MPKSLLERFEDKYVPEPMSGCWLWIGAISPCPRGKTGGYGILQGSNGRMQMAHRISCELSGRDVPAKSHVDHKCRNTLCVNPDHLEPVTAQENIRRGMAGEVARQRQLSKTHCPKGHPFMGGNLYTKPNGRRECRQCVRDSGARYRASKQQTRLPPLPY